MEFNKLEIESRILERDVYQVIDLLDGVEFKKQEDDFIKNLIHSMYCRIIKNSSDPFIRRCRL